MKYTDAQRRAWLATHGYVPKEAPQGMSDTELVDWCIKNKYCPAYWREPATNDEVIANQPPKGNCMVFVKPGDRERIDRAMEQQTIDFINCAISNLKSSTGFITTGITATIWRDEEAKKSFHLFEVPDVTPPEVAFTDWDKILLTGLQENPGVASHLKSLLIYAEQCEFAHDKKLRGELNEN